MPGAIWGLLAVDPTKNPGNTIWPRICFAPSEATTMAHQGGTDGFMGSLSFLNGPASEPMRHSRDVAETLLSMGGEGQLESQSRALALAFLERHDEAVLAYEEAIRDMSRLGQEIAGDSLAMLHFKHGCELARAGRHTQALSALEKAIALDFSWAQEAKQDEAWELLLSHPRFKDLVGDIDQQRLRVAASRTTTADGTPSSDCFHVYVGI
jgi:tetratricopeptide (TPR) repeat protein